MKYQLILQFPATSIEDYDAMIELEDTLISGLGDSGLVDGHDAGSGEMNIFILTDDPRLAFERSMDVVGVTDLASEFKAAYREVGHHGFSVLHPPGLTSFQIA